MLEHDQYARRWQSISMPGNMPQPMAHPRISILVNTFPVTGIVDTRRRASRLGGFRPAGQPIRPWEG